MPPLVLAIEPDLRQAAIVKRIVKERVQADVTVVDSRDAALEAIRTRMPDVLLLSALLSPRDEAELIGHLRTLEDAQHLQTQTIPQLASTMGGSDDEKPTRGLLSAFRRRKGAASVPTGCDPDLFADEVRTYLKRAEEKQRELRDALAFGGVPRTGPIARTAADPSRDEEPAPAAATTSSSWASPFEWRPSAATPPAAARETQAPESPVAERTQAATPEPHVVVPEPSVVLPEPPLETLEPQILASEPPLAAAESDLHLSEWPAGDSVASSDESVAALETYEPIEASSGEADEPAITIDVPVLAAVEPEIPEYQSQVVSFERPPSEPAPVLELARVDAASARSRLPLVIRQPRGWWFVEGKADACAEPESELRGVLASLTVPQTIAAVGYAEGCRIRRVRLAAA
jgi:hypothetical protein